MELAPEEESTLLWFAPKSAVKCPDETFRTGYLELADRAIELAPDSLAPFVVRARIRAAFGREEEGLTDLESALTMMPRDGGITYLSRAVWELYLGIGLAFLDLGHVEKAIETFTTALTVYQRVPGLLHYRGVAYNSLGEYEKAVADFSAAIELRPRHPPQYHGRVNAYLAMKQYDKALLDVTTLIELEPGSLSEHTGRCPLPRRANGGSS